MKKIIGFILFAAVVIAGIAGCKKIIKALFPGVDVDIPEIVVTFPAPPVSLPSGTPVPSGEQSLVSFTQHFNLDSLIKDKTNGKFGAGDVNSVKLKQIIFTLDDPDSQNNFANFKSVRFTLSSNTKPEAQQIVALTFPDTFTPSVTYLAADNTPELRDYLSGNELTYHSFGELRRYTTKAVRIHINVTIRAK